MNKYIDLNEIDNNYKEFQSKLIPNINKDTILGIRTPALRRMAKDIFNSNEIDKFLNDLPHKYYEENLIHFFIISMIKDFEECINEVEKFLPYVDCWPVSDQATPKVFKKNHSKLLPYVKKWIKSKHVYTSRFGIRILMNEYLDNDFKKEYLSIVSNIKSDEYYLKMMIAWYFATALAKQYKDTITYIEDNKLDIWVHNKTIQKAIESYRITNEQKEYLKGLKRR
jgi:3-methyladenine DNA glycosylase AlkD